MCAGNLAACENRLLMESIQDTLFCILESQCRVVLCSFGGTQWITTLLRLPSTLSSGRFQAVLVTVTLDNLANFVLDLLLKAVCISLGTADNLA